MTMHQLDCSGKAKSISSGSFEIFKIDETTNKLRKQGKQQPKAEGIVNYLKSKPKCSNNKREPPKSKMIECNNCGHNYECKKWPAWRNLCSCGQRNHYETACRSIGKPNAAAKDKRESKRLRT